MRKLAEVEQFAGSKSVEITDQGVRARLPAGERRQQRAQVVDAPALSPCGMNGAEMHTERAPLAAVGHQVEVGVPRHARLVPPGVYQRPAAHEAERLARPRSPRRHPSGIRHSLDDPRLGCYLEDDEIGRRRLNDAGERLFTAGPAVADVVGEKPQYHSPVFSISVRNGWSSRPPRN